MNRPLAMILALLAPAQLMAEDERSIIRFANPGFDQLSGTLGSLAVDRLVWNSPLLEKPAPFYLKNVLEVALPTVPPDSADAHEAALSLMNGDVVKGRLVSVTDDAIILDTWYAGRMEFRRLMVREVEIVDRKSLIFSGPTGLDGWVQPTKTSDWTFDRGALRSSGSRPIGRELNLPDNCSMAFDLTWKGPLGLMLNLFGDNLDGGNPTRGYQISCQGGYASVRRLNMMMGGASNMASVPEFRDSEKVRVEVRINRKEGHVCLYVNGTCKVYWKDPEAGKGKLGTAIQFDPNGSMQAVGISRIKVSTWDGVPEIPAGGMLGLQGFGRIGPEIKPAPKPEPMEEGRMKLRNGDSISGEVTAIADGMIQVKTPFAEIKLPVERVRNIMLKPASLEEPIRRNGDVRAWFPDGSSVVFRLDGSSQATVTGSSQTFGTAEFKLAAFNRIEFNIYDPKINDLREGSEP